MAVRGIDNDDVYAGADQGCHPIFGVTTHADRCRDQQTLLRVLCRVGVVRRLLDILDRDQTTQIEVVIYHQYFFNAVPVKQVKNFILAGVFLNSYQALLYRS